MKKATIVFIQGGAQGAHEADSKLVQYLRNALRHTHHVVFPKMPNEDNPDYEIYAARLEEQMERIDGALILVGHSLGATFLLKYLSEQPIDKRILGIFLIATPFWGEGGWNYKGFSINNKAASDKTIDIPIFFYHSNDDETVPFSHLNCYKKQFPHAHIHEIFERGHMLKNDLSEVVKDIKILNKERTLDST